MEENVLANRVVSVSVFSRSSPEHKFKLVDAFQKRGEVVLVTGDGVNDAPALKLANVGAAMGQTGSDIAKSVANMILLEDNFMSLQIGIQESRKLFENLIKSIRFYLACKTALILLFFLCTISKLELPLAPIQVILLEMFMDLGASSTFVVEPPESDIMSRPPRNPKEKILNWKFNLSIFFSALALFIPVFVAYLVGKPWASVSTSQSFAFTAWLYGHVLLALNLRTNRIPVFRHGLSKFFPKKKKTTLEVLNLVFLLVSNRLLLIWMAGIVVILVLVMYVPFLAEIMRLTPLSIYDHLIILLICLLTFSIEIVKIIVSFVQFLLKN